MMVYDFLSSVFAHDEIMKKSQGRCVKMPVAHNFFVAQEEMGFITTSGTQKARPGDYIIIGLDHAWPVTKEYFEQHYHEMPE